MKVLCEGCGTAYQYEIAKGMKVCAVCGKALWEDVEETSNDEVLSLNKDVKNPDLYFYDIDEEEECENDDIRDVWCQCTSCRKVITIPYSQFDIIKSEYLRLKENLDFICEGCGKTINNTIIPRRPDGWKDLNLWTKGYENVPKCPVCSSKKIHKISMTNKAASAAVFGVFAVGHVSKTYKCDICGAKF